MRRLPPRVLRGGALVSLLLPLVAIGTLIGMASADDAHEVRELERRIRILRARVDRLDRERRLLRADRDQLEARLAARAPRAVCPDRYVSTEGSGLLAWFDVDYRCGWHAVHDARSGGGEAGVVVELTLFSRLPIRLAPGAGVPADIEMTDRRDDPARGGDALAPLEEWLNRERARFTAPPQDRPIEAGDGTTIHRLIGTAEVAPGERAPVVVLLWEYDDSQTGARHVVRAASIDPSEQTRAALERLARSFRLRQP